MTVCSFYLQGRCRYGDKCWNEHPRGGGGGGGGRGGGGGGGGGGYNNYSRAAPQHQARGGGAFGNRVWVNPAHKSSGAHVQPPAFSSRGGDDHARPEGDAGADWGRRGGGGRRENLKSSDFSFSQNRFTVLNAPSSSFDKGEMGAEGRDDHLETIQKDMEAWETSGQWVFSCYAVLKASISGFTDLSPEELRLEYYSARASGDLQTYTSGVGVLLSQWRTRVQELRSMGVATRVAMQAELDNPPAQASSGGFGSMPVTGFGSSTTGFGVAGLGSQPASFSFAASGAGFGSSCTGPAPSGFGSTPSSTGSSSFAAPTASSFSFTAPDSSSAKLPVPSGFGSAPSSTGPIPSGFGSAPSSTGPAPSGFGSAPSSAGPASFGFVQVPTGSAPSTTGSTHSTFGSASGFTFSSAVGAGFGGAVAGGAVATAAGAGLGGPSEGLFTPREDLTSEELCQFQAPRFTLGQIPLKPPPADLLTV